MNKTKYVYSTKKVQEREREAFSAAMEQIRQIEKCMRRSKNIEERGHMKVKRQELIEATFTMFY